MYALQLHSVSLAAAAAAGGNGGHVTGAAYIASGYRSDDWTMNIDSSVYATYY